MFRRTDVGFERPLAERRCPRGGRGGWRAHLGLEAADLLEDLGAGPPLRRALQKEGMGAGAGARSGRPTSVTVARGGSGVCGTRDRTATAALTLAHGDRPLLREAPGGGGGGGRVRRRGVEPHRRHGPNHTLCVWTLLTPPPITEQCPPTEDLRNDRALSGAKLAPITEPPVGRRYECRRAECLQKLDHET